MRDHCLTLPGQLILVMAKIGSNEAYGCSKIQMLGVSVERHWLSANQPAALN